MVRWGQQFGLAVLLTMSAACEAAEVKQSPLETAFEEFVSPKIADFRAMAVSRDGIGALGDLAQPGWL